MFKKNNEILIAVTFLLIIGLSLFSFHAITGNAIFNSSNDVKIVTREFKIDNSGQLNEEVNLNDTQNISGPR